MTNTVLLYDENCEEIKEWGLSAVRNNQGNSSNIVEHFKLYLFNEKNELNSQAIIGYLKKIGMYKKYIIAHTYISF